MTDRQIISMLQARTEQVLAVLAQKFGTRLFATARNILSNRQDAEECVNDTYLAVWNAVPPKEPDPLAGFVYKTGRFIALKRLRDDTALKRNHSYDLSLDELSGCIPDHSLDEKLTTRELGRAIDRFLDTLSRDSRIMFLRRYWFGDGVQEIARTLGYSENTVSVRLSRTRAKLRTYLIKEGYMYEP